MSNPSGQKMPPLFTVFICCAASNLFYQLVTGGDFGVGIEHTYYQGGALFIAWLWSYT